MQKVDTAAELQKQRQRLKDRGICVVIPTYNNAGTIASVVQRALQQCQDVIVVCDGCTDNTLQLLHELPLQPDIVVLDKNCGKGTALEKGFRHALKRGFAYAITLDGDGQHYPEDIPLMLEANIQHPGALIVGERKGLKNVSRSKGSSFANAFSNFWFAVQTGVRLKDTQTGYRLYPLKKLYGLSLLTSRYEAELELMVLASWHGVELVSQPVNVYYPPAGERVSHFRPGPDFTRIFILNTILCGLAVVYGYPLKLLRGLRQLCYTIYSLLMFVLFSMLMATPFMFFYLKTGKMTEKKRETLHRMLQSSARFVLRTHGIPGVKYSQTNNSGEDFSKPAVIICNHQSHLDLMPMLLQSPKLVVLTADWVWKNPFFGFLVRNAEFLPISRGMDAILPQLRDLVERGYSIAVYPEGTRSEDCSIRRFRHGAFHIAQELGLDILPLVLYGAGKALPKKGHSLRKWPMHLEIDKRISRRELCAMGQVKEQATAMRRYYIERYARVADKMEQDV